jgi:hypothetical protein
MEDLTNEEHEALLLMSEHGIAAPLSPAAQAVFWAFNSEFDWVEDGVPGPQFKAIAAALRAAADQVAPETPDSEPDDPEMLKGIWDERRTIRAELLAIAAELEGQ